MRLNVGIVLFLLGIMLIPMTARLWNRDDAWFYIYAMINFLAIVLGFLLIVGRTRVFC